MPKGLRPRWGVYVTNIKNKEQVATILVEQLKLTVEQSNELLGFNNPCVAYDAVKRVALDLASLIVKAGADAEVKRVMVGKSSKV